LSECLTFTASQAVEYKQHIFEIRTLPIGCEMRLFKKLVIVSAMTLAVGLGEAWSSPYAYIVTYMGDNVYQLNFGGITNYDFSTITGSYNDNAVVLNANTWYNDVGHAQIWATAIASQTSGAYLSYSYSGTTAIVTGGSNSPVSTVPSASYTYGVATLSAAPEIDGSLAPKVGFLLGCLFLMFGRKKQDSEPMMTA